MGLTGFVFLIAYVAGLALAFFRHPNYGLYTYIAVFYLHPPSRWWGAFLPGIRWSLIAAAIAMIAALRLPPDKDRPAWYSTPPAKILIAFTIWMWIQNLWALAPEVHFEASVLFTKYIVLFFLIYRLVRTPDEIRWFLVAHVAGCAYLGWLGYTAVMSGRLEGVGGPGIDEANALAMHLATAVMIGSMLVLVERRWAMWISLAAMPFMLNAIVLAGSRGAFLAILVGAFVLWSAKPSTHVRLFYGLASLGLVLFLTLAHDVFWERMSTIKTAVGGSEEMDTSAESRLVLIAAQWKMAREYPMGTGHRGTEVLSPLYIDQKYMSLQRNGSGAVGRRSSHNTFMTALVEQGFPGAVLFVMMWGWCAREIVRLKRIGRAWSPQVTAQIAGIGAALAVVFVAGMFVDYLKTEVQAWLWSLLACLGGLATEARMSPQDTDQRPGRVTRQAFPRTAHSGSTAHQKPARM